MPIPHPHSLGLIYKADDKSKKQNARFCYLTFIALSGQLLDCLPSRLRIKVLESLSPLSALPPGHGGGVLSTLVILWSWVIRGRLQQAGHFPFQRSLRSPSNKWQYQRQEDHACSFTRPEERTLEQAPGDWASTYGWAHSEAGTWVCPTVGPLPSRHPTLPPEGRLGFTDNPPVLPRCLLSLAP